MQIDAFGGGSTLGGIRTSARRVQDAGFDGLWIPESSASPFTLSAAAAAATDRLALGTGIAVAFARSPMVTAQDAWLLAEATGGNFHLGLGTQVKPHIERRYSAEFQPPGPRVKEYVLALREIFAAFAKRSKLSFQGDYYSFSLLTDEWSPGPLTVPDPPIYLAAVQPYMCRVVGEVADGIKIHPLHTLAYLDAVVRPNLAAGCERAGRSVDEVSLVCPVMTAVSDDEQSLARQREQLRTRLAFYGSTPGYDIVFERSGWPGVGARLTELMRARDYPQLAATITDEMLDAFAITASWSDLPKALAERYRGRASRVVCYSTLEQWRQDPDSIDRWKDVVSEFKRLATD
ncbi:TIGR03617 family F420-dependent LLM class oxidoreductase [Frankia sp. AgKG'84/4]|uniref:TIGR03617 family F420-dependent LLM class oxidoreductase n=1 Tax=Frankia sp. AgKG'84/4 TaxID=573490 RepID=UPI00200E2307|nr:TIGR03617 family F420-dependent LLM class oxidoreductase [Frankia sp. AgKG'84/4]MCL9794722.1 TIGR03617 family F420-dependent LLM class oxidoreductase [Frankia sp. AgKG'84/4]